MATAYAGGAPQAARSPTTDLLTRHLGGARTHATHTQHTPGMTLPILQCVPGGRGGDTSVAFGVENVQHKSAPPAPTRWSAQQHVGWLIKGAGHRRPAHSGGIHHPARMGGIPRLPVGGRQSSPKHFGGGCKARVGTYHPWRTYLIM